MKELKIMKALRYLLIVMGFMSVLSISAQTPNYGNPYKGQETQSVYTTAQMPAATMGSVDAGFMQSGSNLPMAAQSGVVTTYDKSYLPSRSRRAADSDDDDTPPVDPHGPNEDPIGDMMLPMMLLALVYAVLCVYKRRCSREEIGK
jgi:hypothetical protein